MGYIPSVFDNYEVRVPTAALDVRVSLWDTAGQEEYDRLRPLGYDRVSLFLLVFSVVEPATFENIINKWYPEVQLYCPEVPVVLVGVQTELRDDPATLIRLGHNFQSPIEAFQGLALANELKAFTYTECSTNTGEGVNHVLSTAVQAMLNNRNRSPKKKNAKNCSLL